MLMLTDDAGQLQSLRKKEAKKMLALERRNQILEKLQIEKRVVVSELSQLYKVSEETIRVILINWKKRDLQLKAMAVL